MKKTSTNKPYKDRVIGVRFESADRRKLEELAAKQDSTMARLVRQAVREFLARHGQEQAA